MKKKFNNKIIKNLNIGQIIEVSIAHRFRKEFGWDFYSKSKYKIEDIDTYSIIGRNIDYNNELIKIELLDIESGRFYFNNL